MKKILFGMTAALMLCMLLLPAHAAPNEEAPAPETAVTQTQPADSGKDAKAIGAAIVVGLAAAAGAVGMGIAIGKSVEGISRQPEAEGSIRTTLMLGLVFIETAIIYALVIAILLIFVL